MLGLGGHGFLQEILNNYFRDDYTNKVPTEALRDAFGTIFEVQIASETITKAQHVFLVMNKLHFRPK